MASNIDQARLVKSKARELASQITTVTGVGLTKVGGSYGVKVNLSHAVPELSSLPAMIDGVNVVYAVTTEIKPR